MTPPTTTRNSAPAIDGDEEGTGRLERDIAGIAAEHEHRAMRQVQHAERAVDDRQPRADQRQQRARRQPVEQLRDEIRPGDHAARIGGRSALRRRRQRAQATMTAGPPRRRVAQV